MIDSLLLQRAPRRLIVAAALLAVLLAGGAWALLSSGGLAGQADLRLEVWDHEHGQAVHTRAMQPGERFELEHTHSVTRRPVRETFSVTAAGVAMEELWFDEFGPNLPAGPEEVNGVTTTFLHRDGAYLVRHHGRLLPTVPLRVGGTEVDHVLTFADGTRLRLLDLVRPSAFVELRLSTN